MRRRILVRDEPPSAKADGGFYDTAVYYLKNSKGEPCLFGVLCAKILLTCSILYAQAYK